MHIYQLILPFDDLDEVESQVMSVGPDARGIKMQPKTIDRERWQRPIEFSCWIDRSIAKSSLSQHWLTHTIEYEETYIDEQGLRRSRILVRATAYDEQHIIQQLHKYGAKVELVEPPELRDQMRQEVERVYRLYHK